MQAAALVYLAACLGLRLLLPFPSQGAERTGGTREESFLELLEKGASSLPEDSPFVPVDLSFQWSFRYDDFRPNPEYTKSPLAARIQRLLGEGRRREAAELLLERIEKQSGEESHERAPLPRERWRLVRPYMELAASGNCGAEAGRRCERLLEELRAVLHEPFHSEEGASAADMTRNAAMDWLAASFLAHVSAGLSPLSLLRYLASPDTRRAISLLLLTGDTNDKATAGRLLCGKVYCRILAGSVEGDTSPLRTLRAALSVPALDGVSDEEVVLAATADAALRGRPLAEATAHALCLMYLKRPEQAARVLSRMAESGADVEGISLNGMIALMLCARGSGDERLERKLGTAALAIARRLLEHHGGDGVASTRMRYVAARVCDILGRREEALKLLLEAEGASLRRRRADEGETRKESRDEAALLCAVETTIGLMLAARADRTEQARRRLDEAERQFRFVSAERNAATDHLAPGGLRSEALEHGVERLRSLLRSGGHPARRKSLRRSSGSSR